MNIFRLAALAVSLLFLIACIGCTPGVDATPSSVSTESVLTVTSHPSAEDVTLDIPYNYLWTWNDLYDYLENPLQSGDMAFDEEQGEYVTLYRADGHTSVSRWNERLTQNMVAVKCAQDGGVLLRIYINITGAPDVSSEEEVSEADTASDPALSKPSEETTLSSPSSSVSAVSDPSESSEEGSKESSSHPQTPPQKTVIRINGGQNNVALKAAAKAFNRQSQTVEVEILETDNFMTAARLQQSISENNAPHIVLMNRTEMTLASSQKLLTNLATLGADRMEPLFDSVCWSKTVTGGGYGLPVGCVTSALVCNDEILFRCGVDVPSDLDTLLSYAKTVRDTLPGVTPIGLSTTPTDTTAMAEQFTFLLWNFGGELLTSDREAAAFHSMPGIDTMQLYQQLQQEILIHNDYSAADFFSGNTAYGIIPCTDYSQTFGKQAKDNYTATPLVTLSSEQSVSLMELYSYCITSAGNQATQEAAYQFLAFYFSDAGYSLEDCKSRDWIPALLSAREDQYYQTDAWQVYIDAIAAGRTYPSIDCKDTVDGYLAEAVSSVLNGEDPEIALGKAKEKTENRLERQ